MSKEHREEWEAMKGELSPSQMQTISELSEIYRHCCPQSHIPDWRAGYDFAKALLKDVPPGLLEGVIRASTNPEAKSWELSVRAVQRCYGNS